MPVQSNAQPVSPARYDSYITGEATGQTSATQFADRKCDMVMFKAEAANGGNVYIGVAGVTKKAGTTTSTAGFELAAGDTTPWLPCTNANIFYYICDNATDHITYIAAL